MYNLTNLTTAKNIGDVAMTANNFAGGILFGGLLFAVFFIMLMGLKKWEFDSALVVSSWTCFFLGLLLAYGGFVAIIFPLGFLALAAFGVLYMWASGKL